jgi:trehalose-6-phosphate synthase
MPLDERRERNAAMMGHLEDHDVHAWWKAFLAALCPFAEASVAKAPALGGLAAWH